MRHLRKTKKFHRTQEERLKLFRDLSSALVKSGKIITFTARAKWFRSKFERLITLTKRAGEDTQLAYRRLRPYLSEVDSRKMITEIAPKYKNRAGGYTAVYKLQSEFSSHDKAVVFLVDSQEASDSAKTKNLKDKVKVDTKKSDKPDSSAKESNPEEEKSETKKKTTKKTKSTETKAKPASKSKKTKEKSN